MNGPLTGKTVAFLATYGVEQIELTQPWQTLQDAGAQVTLISPKPDRIDGYLHLDKGDSFKVDTPVDQARADDYAALVLPGGVANPDALRQDPATVSLVRQFIDQGKPVAAICHGPWTLIEPDAVRGKTLTSFPSLKTDINNAGGHWVDEQVHSEAGLITSRKPADLDAFCDSIIAALS